MTAPPTNEDEAFDEDVDEDEEDEASSAGRNALEWIGIIVLALIAAFLIKTFLLQAFYIPSPSMHPTLKVKDRVLVNKLSGTPSRGDIVVFERPPAEKGGDPAIKDLIKRVIALPGETVEGKEGHVFINGKQLVEPYLPEGMTTGDFDPRVIAPNEFFLMGDNRPQSKDSRMFGAIPKDLLVGKAFIRVWPIPRIKLL